MSRIVVVDKAYFQAPNIDPLGKSLSFVRVVESDDTPFFNPRMKVGPDPSRIDAGWVENPGELVVVNTSAEHTLLLHFRGVPAIPVVRNEHVRVPIVNLADWTISAGEHCVCSSTVHPR